MLATIQIKKQTPKMLKKIKEEKSSHSHDKAVVQVMQGRTQKHSMAGYLKKYIGRKTKKEILRGLRDKHDRY